MLQSITQPLVDYFSRMSPEAATFVLSMIPVTEIRVSIPLALTVFDLPVWKTLLLAVTGDMIPAVCILLLIRPLHNYVIAHPRFLGKVVTHYLVKAQNKFSGKYARWGAVALVIFVGIPLPGTGSWTGSLAAFVFGIPFKKALALICAGVILASVILTVLTLGAGGLWELVR